MTDIRNRNGSRRARTALLPVLALAAISSGACNDLLDVDAPSRVVGGTLAVPGNAPLLVASAIADFECAYAFYALTTGLLTDELIDTQLAAATWDYDRRGFANGEGSYADNTCNATGNIPGVYKPVSTARWSADNALRLLEGWTDDEVPDRQALIARAAAYGGYAYLLLGEGFCSAAVDGGPELTTEQVFQMAEEHFTKAITAAQTTSQADILNMAYVGRARARLDLGDAAGAAADAQLVPAGFVLDAAYSSASSRSGNHVFRWNNRFDWASVDPRYQNLEFGGVADPRVTVIESGETGADAFTKVWKQTKYPTEDTPIAIASYVEAQLIIADVEGGQTAVDIINALHDAAGLPHFQSTSTAEIRAQIIEERSRELFLTGHRAYDFIRYDLPLEPAAGATYPIKGGVYGDTKCFLLPEIERVNNPNIGG